MDLTNIPVLVNTGKITQYAAVILNHGHPYMPSPRTAPTVDGFWIPVLHQGVVTPIGAVLTSTTAVKNFDWPNRALTVPVYRVDSGS